MPTNPKAQIMPTLVKPCVSFLTRFLSCVSSHAQSTALAALGTICACSVDRVDRYPLTRGGDESEKGETIFSDSEIQASSESTNSDEESESSGPTEPECGANGDYPSCQVCASYPLPVCYDVSGPECCE